jgi:ABC-type sugar transport system ATPase subunit
VGKSFGGVRALGGVSFQLREGTALGLVGENGAGKSTLMKILSGIFPAGSYEGEVHVRGEVARFRSVQDARAAGIVQQPQELLIAPGLSIAENMFAGALPNRRGWVLVGEVEARAREWLRFFGLDVDPHEPASILSPAEQRLSLIAGALSLEARILILDEPTASLSEGESQILFAHMERLRDEGIGILFISHRLDDISQVCDEVVVLRNGTLVAHFPDRDVRRDEIVRAMIGSSSVNETKSHSSRTQDVVLSVRNLVVLDPQDRGRRRVDDVSFDVHAGEIMGIFGLVGAGRTEVLRALFGIWPVAPRGEFWLSGKPYEPSSPTAAIRRGMALLSEDRKQTGIFPGHSIQSNFDAASPHQVSSFGFLSSHRDDERSQALMHRLGVRATGIEQPIDSLSGGNQQKVVLGRWLAAAPAVLLLDEPTAGVDIGAREDLYQEIEAMAADGCGVLLVSSDLDEVRRLADRTSVMFKGRLVAEYEQGSRHELMASATGGVR